MNHSKVKRSRKDMVRSTIRMLIPLDKQSEALEILSYVSRHVLYEPRCICSRIYRGMDEVRAIMVEDFWDRQRRAAAAFAVG